MKIRSLTRIGVQLLLSGLVLYSVIGSSPELKLLFIVLLFVNMLAIFLSSFITLTMGKDRILNSVMFNMGLSILFFLIGVYLQDLLTYEIIEESKPDEMDHHATVIKARNVSFGGIQFLLIAIVHAMLSYIDFFEIRLTKETQGSTQFSDTLFSVKIGKKLHLIPFSEIDFIEASGNYVQIHQGEKHYPARLTLQEFYEKAHSENLIRVHRSFIINMTQVRELEGSGDGYMAVLKSGRKIKIGKQYKQELFQQLGIEN